MSRDTSKDGAMRQAMPAVSAFIDSMRATFGKEIIDQAISDGLKDGTFWAQENGHTVGYPFCYYPRPVEALPPVRTEKGAPARGRK